MKKLILILLLSVVGCATNVPVVAKFPGVPDDMLKSCPDLVQINPDETKLSSVVEGVVNNYKQYYDCKDKSDNWIEWYQSQKKIFDSIK